MNQPPYILVDVLKECAEATRISLGLPVLNYQYGYITELNETLNQYAKTVEFQTKKFPLIWIRQPFTLARNSEAFLGRVNDLTFFIMSTSNKTAKAHERMELTFKPTLYPIYDEFLSQMDNHIALSYDGQSAKHDVIDRYYWGTEQQSYLTDVVDCMEIRNMQIKVNNNSNCITFKNF